jgi:LysM repeat protein
LVSRKVRNPYGKISVSDNLKKGSGEKMKSIFVIFVAALLVFGLGVTPAAAQTQVCGSTYVAQPGDYLIKIAGLCGVTYASLLAANPQIGNPSLIYPNQVINIPNGGTTGGTTGSSGGTTVTGGSIYLVKPGDFLTGIASRFGVSLSSVLVANPGLTIPSLIYPGMAITLPQGAQQVPTVSITPTTGVTGGIITLAATGFSANTSVLVSFGLVGGTFSQLERISTDAHGALYKSYTIPSSTSIVPRNGQYEFRVAREDNASVSADSNPITLTSVGTSTPGTGSSYYLVKPGDNLSRIAAAFGTTVSAILAVNPTIGPNFVIYPGQYLLIPTSASISPSGAYVSVSATTAHPGGALQVSAGNFPANADVDVRIGKQGQAYSAVVDSKANAQGMVSVQINVPSSAVVGEQWVVTVTTTELVNGVQGTSLPITIN